MPTLHLSEDEYRRVLFLVHHHGDANLERTVAAVGDGRVTASWCGAALASWSCELPHGHAGEHYSRDGLKVWR
jgi:hypothetical protein